MQTQSILWLTEEDITLAQLQHFASGPILVTPDVDGKVRVQCFRAVVEQALAADRPVYGVNTGFGKHEAVKIAPDQVQDLQRRLILSYAAGVGTPIPIDIVRLMSMCPTGVKIACCIQILKPRVRYYAAAASSKRLKRPVGRWISLVLYSREVRCQAGHRTSHAPMFASRLAPIFKCKMVHNNLGVIPCP
ncbi:hypothetical protein C2W62_20745 [Candidatus Entotheonella serta]|nr:hypothetical protein C2W62_20745 [Candidatus Entotheonella serta]